MRAAKPIVLLVIATALVWALDRPWGTLPALGRLLDPVNGAMAAAEPTDHDFGGKAVLQGLRAPVTVWYDHRLVPHIRAQNNHDLYFAQGYIHALFRLWQMDLQTRAAGGRVSEVLGPKAVDYDRAQRRKGMMYAAENSVRAMEDDPRTREALNAYRDGINAHIASLSYRTTPLEYKLMGFSPEKWTNLRTALLLKYMADDLTGYTEDIPLTYLRDRLSKKDFDLLYPLKIPGSKHVVPAGTPHPKASMAVPPVPGDEDSLFAHFVANGKQQAANGKQQAANGTDMSSAGGGGLRQRVGYLAAGPALAGGGCAEASSEANNLPFSNDYETGVGSNSWVISPELTASGAAILCNDPHLALNLPSLWFEVQLQAPGINCYGVSLPGAPGIIIGFNDSVSWGLTNNYRDVKDYYEIHTADADHYWFDGAKKPFQKRVERIDVKGGGDLLDTVLYTVHGPVQYDARNLSPDSNGRMLAMCWMGHRATNELLAVWGWNRATDVASFRDAIQHFECPAQNIAYADHAGNYAQFTQGRYINKWPGQGRFVMNGVTSKTLWGADIPMEENPFALNHPQGYLVAANQSTTDDAYPYWYNGNFSEWRAWTIDKHLGNDAQYNVPQYLFNRDIPHGVGNAQDVLQLSDECLPAQRFWPQLKAYYTKAYPNDTTIPNYNSWNGLLSANSQVAPFFHWWWRYAVMAASEQLTKTDSPSLTPPSEVIASWLDSVDAELFVVSYPASPPNATSHMTVADDARQKTSQWNTRVGPEFYQHKNTHINHLTKIPAFGFGPLKVGGWGTTINANKVNEKGQAYGPSWRMIVEMDRDSIRAYGHYPGGQSGNVGSKWYANMLQDWVDGKYYRLLFFLSNAGPAKKDVQYTLTLNPAR